MNVPGVVTYDGTIATLKPTIDLAANTVLTVTVATGAKDLRRFGAQNKWGSSKPKQVVILSFKCLNKAQNAGSSSSERW